MKNEEAPEPCPGKASPLHFVRGGMEKTRTLTCCKGPEGRGQRKMHLGWPGRWLWEAQQRRERQGSPSSLEPQL